MDKVKIGARSRGIWLRALLAAAELLASAEAIIGLRRGEAANRLAFLAREVERLRSENELLRTRLERMSPLRRARYTGSERLRILWHHVRYGLSLRATAAIFVLQVSTLTRWLDTVNRGAKRIVRGLAPVNRLADVVRELTSLLRFEQPSWGTRRIAQVLARLGVQVSRSSVQRFLREKPRRPRRGGTDASDRSYPGVRARRPHDVWLVDFTTLSFFFGLLEVRIGAVLDFYSRSIVAIGIRRRRPTGTWVLALLRSALRSTGTRPRCVITDHGREFIAESVERFLAKRKIRHRFGAVEKHGSIARIERFWCTLKREWRVPAFSIWFAPRLAVASLHAWARWYQEHRPHQGLGGRTPEDVVRDRALPPPIRIPPRTRWQVECELVDGERTLPVYHLRRAA